MSATLVTVGVPVRNAEKFLADTLNSIASQDYKELEIIVSDNASQDGSEAIIRSFVSRCGFLNVTYHRNCADLGALRNFRTLLDRAHGGYFLWWADHDLRDHAYISTCVSILESSPNAVLCHSESVVIDENASVLEYQNNALDTRGMPPRERFLKLMEVKYHDMFYGVFRTEALRKKKFVNCFGHDVILLARLALEWEFAKAGEPLFFRRINKPRSHSFSETWKIVSATFFNIDPKFRQRKARMLYTRLFYELWKVILETEFSAHEKFEMARAVWRFQIPKEMFCFEVWYGLLKSAAGEERTLEVYERCRKLAKSVR